MSQRPAPRKSSLTGSSPFTPPQSAPIESAPAAPSPDETKVAPPKPAEPTPGTGGRKYPPKVSFYQDPADTDRIRGAILHTMATESYRNLSQFLHEAAMEKLAALEAKYNGGKPFPPVGPRDLPQGRPMGE